ncbi:adenylate/guanylate cyclase domain-containing protein [Hoeflea sp.]|uniref:adenylate/guanylate cyclase domain-containing protein n=1 Tax=Hoeflea sp. TaxID=1940281 RepID=UPI003B02BE86
MDLRSSAWAGGIFLREFQAVYCDMIWLLIRSSCIEGYQPCERASQTANRIVMSGMALKKSISTRFNFALLLIVAVLMAVFSAIAASITSQRILLELDEKLSNYLQLSATALEQPLWNFDNEVVEGFIESLMQDNAVVFANVVSGDGSEIEEVQPGIEKTSFEDFSSSDEYTAGTGEIQRSGQTIGSIKLVLSHAEVRSQIAAERWAIAILALAVLGTVTVASILISRIYIARPLDRLSQSAIAIGKGDLEAKIDVSGQDEIGTLARRFDEMRNSIGRLVADLNTSKAKLQDANLKLEERVKQRTKEVMTAQQKLIDAIESTSEGFAFFDADDRLVLHNERYQTLLYGGTEIEIKAGMPFEDIVRAGIERGLITVEDNDVEAFVAKRIAQHQNPGEPILQRRGDDFWLQISEQKTSDGGTVSVFSDVSELKNREADLTEKTQALEHLSNQLAKYLSPQVYESIFSGKQDVVVASARKKLTVFFSDIVGFTETAEQMEAEELTAVLNNYLTEMSKIAMAHGATIDKYIGDAVLAFFGDPESKGVRQDAIACAKMAVAMSERLAQLREEWHNNGILWPLEVRMGIHTDYCTVGNFGSDSRMDYTIIGRGVNAAARLQSAAEPGKILMSYATYAQVKQEIPCIAKGQVEVKGISNPIDVYEVDNGTAAPVSISAQKLLSDELDDLGIDSMSVTEKRKFESILAGLLKRLHDSAEQTETKGPRKP